MSSLGPGSRRGELGDARATPQVAGLKREEPAVPVEVVRQPPGELPGSLERCASSVRLISPLAPIEVIVGSVLLRPFLSQYLAAHSAGAVGLSLVTLGEFGARFGSVPFGDAGHSRLDQQSDRALAAAVAHASEGYFGVVRDAAGFADASRRTCRELRLLPDGAADTLAALAAASESPAKGDALVDLVQRTAEARAGYWDGADALSAADPDLFDGAALFVYGVSYLPDSAKRLIEAIAERVPVTIFLPALHDEAAQAYQGMVTWLERIGAEFTDALAPEEEPMTALGILGATIFGADLTKAPSDGTVRMLSAPDPVAEVREAVRTCLDWAEEGIPFREMAITYRQADPYEPIIESVLHEAGIPAYLHHGSSLAERPLGRRVLGLIDLIESNLGRAEVVALLSDGRLPEATRERIGFVPTGPKVDKLSREMGIVGGRTQWEERLDAAIADAVRREREPDAPEWAWQRPRDLRQIKDIIQGLDQSIRALPERGTWAHCAQRFKGLVTVLISDDDPDLGFLDSFDRVGDQMPEVDFSEFTALLRHDLEGGVFRTSVGDSGAFRRRGINVLDVNQVSRLGFRAVCGLGIGERQFPPPPRQDPLLLDHERIAFNTALGKPPGEGLPLRAFGPDQEPYLFAMTVNAASDRLLLSYARSDGAGSTGNLPSSFFVRAASALAGRRLNTDELDAAMGPRLLRIPASRIGAPGWAPPLGEAPMDVDCGRVLTLAEWDLTSLESDGEHSEVGRAVLDAVAPGRVPRARELNRSRWAPRLTEFDGLTASEAATKAIAEGHEGTRPFSATRLERYAGCPLRYMFENVLGVKVLEQPEDIIEADKRELGTLVHSVLERFVVEMGAEAPDEDNREALQQVLNDIVEEEFARFEDRGLAGTPLLWKVTQQELIGDLYAWLEHEIENPRPDAERHVEVSFGMEVRRHEGGWAPIDPDSLSVLQPLELTVVNPPVRISGMIDRLDADLRGKGYSVMDYKTGSGKRTENGSLAEGTALQLPLYLLGGQFILDRPANDGRAEYINFSRRNGFKSIIFTGDDLVARKDDFETALHIIIEGIRGGDFHPEPSNSECRYCDFNTLCDSARYAQADRKADDPQVQRFRSLREIA